MTFVENAMQYSIPVIRKPSPPPISTADPLNPENQSSLDRLRLSHVHALACSSKAGYQAAEVLLGPLRTIASGPDSSKLERMIGKYPLPPGVMHMLAFQYLCSRLMNHSEQEKSGAIADFADNFATLLNRLPLGTCIDFIAEAYLKVLRWMVRQPLSQWDSVLPAPSQRDESVISVVVEERTRSLTFSRFSAKDSGLKRFHSIALAHPSQMESKIRKHSLFPTVARILTFQYLYEQLVEHPYRASSAELAGFTRNFAHLLDTVPAPSRIMYAITALQKFAGLTSRDLQHIMQKLPDTDFHHKNLFHFSVCNYQESIAVDNGRAKTSHLHCQNHPGVFFRESERLEELSKSPLDDLKSGDVEKYASIALRTKEEILIVMLADAVSKSTDLLCLPAFLEQPIPAEALIACLKKVLFSEEKYASILLHLMSRRPEEWPKGLPALLADNPGTFALLRNEKSVLLARWTAIFSNLNKMGPDLAKLIAEDRESMLKLLDKMKSEMSFSTRSKINKNPSWITQGEAEEKSYKTKPKKEFMKFVESANLLLRETQ